MSETAAALPAPPALCVSPGSEAERRREGGRLPAPLSGGALTELLLGLLLSEAATL